MTVSHFAGDFPSRQGRVGESDQDEANGRELRAVSRH